MVGITQLLKTIIVNFKVSSYLNAGMANILLTDSDCSHNFKIETLFDTICTYKKTPVVT